MECPPPSLPRSQPFAHALLLFISATQLAQAEKPQPTSRPSATATTTNKSQPTSIIRALRNDAAINAIAFVNPTTGWSVGDRGVIWHTKDGGTNWQQQPTIVSCSLNAVFFIDARRGWAAGGQCQPYSNATRGALLRTEDGGNTWRQLPQPLLPSLAGIKFFDPNHGVAFGQNASYYPSGVFATHDGGSTWQPLPADRSGSWLTGDFLELDAGALAGPAGQIATLVRRKVIPSPLAAPSLRSIRAMRLIAPTGGWAVGDGGLLLTTSDLGHSWQTPPASPLQRAGETVANHFDFRAVAVQGCHVWVAGSPGSRIFHSPDSGKTWQSVATNQTAPIRSLCFVDDSHGWAAGDFGSILATHDGGQSWQPQRAGAKRAALLAIFANPSDVPLEMLSDSGAAEGYITAVDILCSNADGEVAGADGTSATGQRAREALLLAGAAAANTAWRFPLPAADLALTPEDLLAALNRENDGRAIQQLQSHLIRELRLWRPDVVVLHHGTTNTNTAGISAIIEQSVARAVIAAADANQQPELATDIGLVPWQVKKVYGLVPPGTRGEEVIDTARFSPWLGAPLAVFASPARSLLFAERTPPPDAYELKLLWSSTAQDAHTRGVFGGIALTPGSEARRRQPDPPTQDIDNLRRLATRRRNVEQLLERTQGNAAWSAQVNQMIDGLSDDDSGQLLVQLAEGYRKTGRLDMAADTYFLFARRAPDHPLVDPALTWLVHFYASTEVAHRLASRSAPNIRAPAALKSDGEPASAGGPAPAAHKDGAIQQAAAITAINSVSPPDVNLSHDARLRRAIQLADYLRTTRPAVYAESPVRFAEVTAERQLGFTNPSQRLFLSLRQLPETDPWRQCAATEEWLAKPSESPPSKKLATCRRAPAPPHLDGKLDEPFWNTTDRLRLRSSDSPHRSGEGLGEGSTDTEVHLAHDDQFLYIAIHCPKADNIDYATDDTPRSHDADLTQHDRVSLRIDIDRDYSTAYELTVDHRGWTQDACWGDATWDPTWYVAAANDENSWTIEAAIPLSEMVDKPPASRDVWAVAIRRTIPRTGYQTWSAVETRGEAASEDSPAQFGLLLFE